MADRGGLATKKRTRSLWSVTDCYVLTLYSLLRDWLLHVLPRKA